MLVRTHHIAARVAHAVGQAAAATRRAKYHATLPGAVRLDGSIAPADRESSVQAAGAGRGAESISPPDITTAASPATMYCLMALSFTSPLAMNLLVTWAAFAAFDGSLPSRPAIVTSPQ